MWRPASVGSGSARMSTTTRPTSTASSTCSGSWRPETAAGWMRAMDEARFAELAEWITREGLVGSTEAELMPGFCERAVAAGLPLATGLMIIDTLHPIHECPAVRWYQAKDKETEFVEYGRTNEGEAAADWRASPFYRLVESGAKMCQRRRPGEAVAGSRFFKIQ